MPGSVEHSEARRRRGRVTTRRRVGRHVLRDRGASSALAREREERPCPRLLGGLRTGIAPWLAQGLRSVACDSPSRPASQWSGASQIDRLRGATAPADRHCAGGSSDVARAASSHFVGASPSHPRLAAARRGPVIVGVAMSPAGRHGPAVSGAGARAASPSRPSQGPVRRGSAVSDVPRVAGRRLSGERACAASPGPRRGPRRGAASGRRRRRCRGPGR